MIRRGLAGFSLLAILAACAAPEAKSRDQVAGLPSVRVAEAAVSSGDLQLAESIYAKASAAAPSDAAMQVRYADALIRGKKIAQARGVLVSHLNTVRDPGLLRGPLGIVYIMQGEPAAALKELDAANAADPANMRWIINKAIALDLLGQHTEAQALYRQVLANDPDDTIVTNNLALSLALSGQKGDAARLASSLADRTDLPERITLTQAVLRAANGSDISYDREAVGAANYDHALRLAKAIDSDFK
jgi:Flp pilus assembly protein TadD